MMSDLIRYTSQNGDLNTRGESGETLVSAFFFCFHYSVFFMFFLLFIFTFSLFVLFFVFCVLFNLCFYL